MKEQKPFNPAEPFLAEGFINIYGKRKIESEQVREALGEIKSSFRNYYLNNGYFEHLPEDISSGIDPTVRFIGSHISVFKRYLESRTVPEPGYFMVQNCIRTRNADNLFNDDYFPNWGSYFPSLGTIAHAGRLQKSTEEALVFLTSELSIAPQHIIARVRSTDTDLFNVCDTVFGRNAIEVDTMPERYYRHKLGMNGVRGRNFNIALKNVEGEGYSDVANIIVIENDQQELGVELALGGSTTLKQIYGLDHVLDCHPIKGFENHNATMRRKFQDCIIINVALYREGLRPGGSDNKRRLLRTYMRGLAYLRAKTATSIDDLHEIMSDFEKKEYGSESGMVGKVIRDVVAFEDNIKENDIQTSEEKVVRQASIDYNIAYAKNNP